MMALLCCARENETIPGCGAGKLKKKKKKCVG